MAITKKSLARITLRTVIDHMDRKFQAVDARFDSLEGRLNEKIDGVQRGLNEKIDGAERRLTRQMDGLDKRLDDIEITEIPKLKKVVGAR